MPWMREVVEYALRHVPRDKLSMGIITNSMHWYTSQEDRITPELARSYSAVLGHGRALGLAERYGATLALGRGAAERVHVLSNGGTFEWIFLEDARSFAPRLALVDEYNLRGFSVWVIGSEDPEIWTLLRRRGGR
jgi:spore germination protein YaaH